MLFFKPVLLYFGAFNCVVFVWCRNLCLCVCVGI